MAQTPDKSRFRYKVDLVDLHTLCEMNYRRVLRLFPDYECANSREFVAGGAKVVMEVIDRARYTTTFRVTQRGVLGIAGTVMDLELRVYHDARMAEVTSFQAHKRLVARYGYPNPQMYQRDEKFQQNRFAGELFEFCLAEGMTVDSTLKDLFK